MKNVRIEGIEVYMLGVRNISIQSILFHKTRVKVLGPNIQGGPIKKFQTTAISKVFYIVSLNFQRFLYIDLG